MPWSPKIPIAPGTSWDGRVGASAYWGKYTRKVKMCPHVKPGGGQCGLEAKHCMCLCLLCQAPMSARKRCGAKLPDGSICPWGQDRSPEVSEPEQDPEHHPVPRRIPWHRGLVPNTPPGRVPSDNPPVLYTSPVFRTSPPVLATGSESFGIPGICLPNLVPGGYCGLPRTPGRKERTPKKQKLTSAQWQEMFVWKSDAED
jgi:hypothetical protein